MLVKLAVAELPALLIIIHIYSSSPLSSISSDA